MRPLPTHVRHPGSNRLRPHRAVSRSHMVFARLLIAARYEELTMAQRSKKNRFVVYLKKWEHGVAEVEARHEEEARSIAFDLYTEDSDEIAWEGEELDIESVEEAEEQ